jgi:MFS family permease
MADLVQFYGRRIIYIVSFAIFLIWLIPCAVAPNIQTMIVARFFNGLSGSAFLSVAGGTVGDLFHRNELGGPMMFYTASPFIGPEIGPLAAGFINEYASWHWTFYSLMIWSGALLASIVLLVPETYHPIGKQPNSARRRETKDTSPQSS